MAGISVLSGDGRFVFFEQGADFRVMPPTSASQQLYRRELSTGHLDLVSVDLTDNVAIAGVNAANYESCATSRDGRFVAFSSREEDLALNDWNGWFSDVFVRDMQTSVTEVISVDSLGGPANWESYVPSVSSDGRYVAFLSEASNLVPFDFNQGVDVFVRDRMLLTTERVSVTSTGIESDYTGLLYPAIFGVSISGDGRYVAFGSDAHNLTPNDTNQTLDVFVHDQLTGTTELVAHPPGSMSPPITGTGLFPALSFDGRYAAFTCYSHDLVPGAASFGPGQTVVCDRSTGICQLVSVSASGQPASAPCTAPSITPDGRYVTFSTDASNLVPQDSNNDYDAFVRDMQTGTLVRWSSNAGGAAANGFSELGGISDDGTLITVDSAATDFVAGIVAGGAGTTLIDRTISAPPIATYCTPKTNSQGCAPAIAPLGLPTLSGKYAYFVTASRVLNNRKGALAWGFAQAQTPFMGGTLCVQAPLRIVAPQDSHGLPGDGNDCTGWHSFRMTPQWMQARSWSAGTTIFCQYFCRDTALVAPDQLSLSEGLKFTAVP